MTIDWSALIAKKRSLGKPDPTPRELDAWEARAGKLLGVDRTIVESDNWAESLGYGMRTLALVTPYPGVPHRYAGQRERVVVKLFRGPVGEHVRFHAEYFSRCPVLHRAPIQASVAAGVDQGCGYAVLEFVPGITLRSAIAENRFWTKQRAAEALNDLIEHIWIPVWSSGLRFKDCHPGNFVLCETTSRLVMIDAEQMRKPAIELLDTPQLWSIRHRHQDNALSRLPKLIGDTIHATGTTLSRAALARAVGRAIEDNRLPQCLTALGRGDDTEQAIVAATDAWQGLVSQLETQNLL